MDITYDKPVVNAIREQYDKLFSAEKKVADFILSNPEEAVNANVSSLANSSGVSDATVIRFCKHIGYEGYYQLRICLSRDMGRSVKGQEQNENTVGNLFQSYANQMVEVGKKNSDERMQKCVDLIKGCDYVHIAAVGNSIHLAQYLGFRLGRLGIRATYNGLPEYSVSSINLAKRNDIVFAISKSGSSKQVVQAMELAKERHLKVIALTGCEYSPVSRLADCLLLSDSETQPFDYYKEYSHLKEIAVIDSILHFVTDENLINSNDAKMPEMIFSETKY